MHYFHMPTCHNACPVVYSFKRKNGGSNILVAPNLCILHFNGICQGMGIMHSAVMDTVVHSSCQKNEC